MEKDIDIEDIVYAASKHPEVLEKIIKGIEDSEDYSKEEKNDYIKKLKKAVDFQKEKNSEENSEEQKEKDDLKENIDESLVFEKIKGSWLTDFVDSQSGLMDVIHMEQNRKVLDDYRKQIKNETDPDKKKELEKKYNTFKTAVYVVDRKGRRQLGGTDLAIKRNIKLLKKEGELPEDFSYDDVKNERKEFKERKKAEKSGKPADAPDKNKEPKEEIVKDKTGVKWIKRKKMRGEGYTYCRADDKTITMSQDEYRKKNESLSEYINRKLIYG